MIKERALNLLSVVVPCFNEEAVIRETHRGPRRRA